MIYRPAAADFNRFFRGTIYGQHDIFTTRSYADFVRRHDIDLDRALCRFQGTSLIGTIVFAQRGERAWLALMGVAHELRGRGYGKHLFGGAVDAVRASGARSIEFEVVQRNAPAIAMYRSFGFETADELLVWARRARASRSADLTFRRYGVRAMTEIAHHPPTCWQREPCGISRAGHLALIETSNAYAFIRKRDEYAVVVDAWARDEESARELLRTLDQRVPYDLTLPNEPSNSALSLAMRDSNWRIVERQHRMMRSGSVRPDAFEEG